jgi:DNA polymerase-3 subunit delta'
MSWQEVYGHDELVERFRLSVRRGRLASTFLFIGPQGVGKRTFAVKLAQALLCEVNPENVLDPCGHCEACVQVRAASHPDLIVLGKPADRAFIPVETFIGDREHRMQVGLCHDISLKPFRGGRKVAIIDDADAMNVEGANCLLKTLEEPPPHSLLILIGTSEQKQLPTIRSRSQIVRFAPLSEEVVARLLLEQGIVEDGEEARRLAELSEGSLKRALTWTDAELRGFRDQLLDFLADPGADVVGFAREATGFVNAAGKEAPPRRERLRNIIGFALDFYRQLMRILSGTAPAGDRSLTKSVDRGAQTWTAGPEAAAACLDRCLDALAYVDANANQATLIECWLDDLVTLSQGKSLAPFAW